MMLVRVVCLQVVALRLAIGIPVVSLSSTQSSSADLESVALPHPSDAGDPAPTVPTPQLGTPHVLPFGIWVTSRTGENTCPAPMHIMHSS